MRNLYFSLLCGIIMFAAANTTLAQSSDSGPLHWEIADGTLTISGTGNMPHYDDVYAPWDEYLESVIAVVVQEGVASIGNNAFLYGSGITSVSIANTVTAIGDYAFQYCSGLTSVAFPESVASVGVGIF